MRFVIALLNALRDAWRDATRVLAFKLRLGLIVFGLVFAWSSLPHVVMPLAAELSFAPSVATVMRAGWACGDDTTRMRWCAKGEAEARQAAKSKLRTAYFVNFSYAAPDGGTHNAHWLITSTGLRERDAVPGYRFDILVDPADPRRVSMRFGGDLRNTVMAAGSLFSVFLGVTWWVAVYRRRRREAAQDFVMPAGPVFTADGQRIHPLGPAPVFGRRAPSR